jgi:hypothetical protein
MNAQGPSTAPTIAAAAPAGSAYWPPSNSQPSKPHSAPKAATAEAYRDRNCATAHATSDGGSRDWTAQRVREDGRVEISRLLTIAERRIAAGEPIHTGAEVADACRSPRQAPGCVSSILPLTCDSASHRLGAPAPPAPEGFDLGFALCSTGRVASPRSSTAARARTAAIPSRPARKSPTRTEGRCRGTTTSPSVRGLTSHAASAARTGTSAIVHREQQLTQPLTTPLHSRHVAHRLAATHRGGERRRGGT